jgi:N-succinyldiaminopimelate aminotransferase
MINNALERLTDYPFDRLRSLLDPLQPAAGKTPVIMSLGEPQHPPPAIIADTVAKHADEWGRYPPTGGTPDHLKAITEWLGRRYQIPGDLIDATQNVVAVSGTREALYLIGDLVIPRTKGGRQPTVLIPNPFYQVYVGAAVMGGAEPIYVPATADNQFLPDYAGLDKDILDRTALAYVCSPANPQGTIADLDYLVTALELARAHDFVLVVDECYAEIYDTVPPPGALEAAAQLGGSLDHLLIFHSLSKRSSAPGLRAGFVAGDPDLVQRFKMLRAYAGATLPNPIHAAAAALWRDEAHAVANRELYRAKFDHADAILGDRPGYYRPAGGFYIWLDVGDGEAAAARLWTEAAVKVIPGGYLAKSDAAGNNPGAPYIRIALVQDPETVADALKRIAAVL